MALLFVQMIYLTSEIEEQFKNIVEEVDWLSESTKETARNKLDAMIHNIGYPDLVLNDTELSGEINGVCFAMERNHALNQFKVVVSQSVSQEYEI